MSAWNEFTPGPQPSVTCMKLTFRISTAPSPTSFQLPFCSTGITCSALQNVSASASGSAESGVTFTVPAATSTSAMKLPTGCAVRHLPGVARELAPARTERRDEDEPGEARRDRVCLSEQLPSSSSSVARQSTAARSLTSTMRPWTGRKSGVQCG